MYSSLTFALRSPTSDGAAAAVVASEEFVKSHGLEDRAVRIVGQEMVTDMESSFERSPMNVAGYGMSKRAAELLYRNTGLSPKDFQVYICNVPLCTYIRIFLLNILC